jgi:hypothetical protein
LKHVGNDDLTFVILSDTVMRCEVKAGEPVTSFNYLQQSTPDGFMDNLARQLEGLYELKVEIVPGADGGLVLRRDSKQRKS